MSVFISYAREDIDAARKLYIELMIAGAEPWLDKKDLLGGQRWKRALSDAISRSRYFVAMLSSRSVDKRGFVQKEIKQALDHLDEFSDADVFVIPVRLDDCNPSNHDLRDLQWIDLFPDWHGGVAKLLQAMGIESGRAAAEPLLELLKQIYIAADRDIDRVVDAIRGFQDSVDVKSGGITDDDWSYIETSCPDSVIRLFKSEMPDFFTKKDGIQDKSNES